MQLSFRMMSMAIAMVGLSQFAGASSIAPGGASGNPDDSYLTNGGPSSDVSLADGPSAYATSSWDVFAPEGLPGGTVLHGAFQPQPEPLGTGFPASSGGSSGYVGYPGPSGSSIGSVSSGGVAPGTTGSIGKSAIQTPGTCTTPEPSYLLPLGALMLVVLARRRQVYAMLVRAGR